MRFGSVCSGVGRPAIDLTGQIFGRLTVIHRAPSNGHGGRPRWVCKCECGTQISIPGARLRDGHNKSCGCLRRDRAGNLYRTHGKSKTPEYCMFYDARKRAQKLGLPFSITPEDIIIPIACPVLGIPLDWLTRDSTPSLDRFRPERGYTAENIHVISFRANRIKSDANTEELSRVLAYSKGEIV